ncbi:MAG: YtxH domain-containing protein [Chitinophagaceae bacterium]
MNNNSKLIAGILVGAAAGAAITLLLSTENGKKVFADLKDLAAKSLHNLQSGAAEVKDNSPVV